MPVTCAHLSVSSFSQHFVCLPLSIQRLQACSKYIHVCSGAPSLAHKACTRYTERPNLRCWLPALRSTLFICHFRYNARRHAASTSMYAQVRHPWRTRPVRIIPKSRTCAAGSQLPAFHSPLFICHFRYNARRHAASTSMYAQVRHPWRTRPVRVIPKSRTCASGSQLPAPSSRLSALGSRLSAFGFRLSALGSRLSAPSSRLPAPNSQPSIVQTIIHPRLNSRTQVLLFSYNQVQLSFKVPVRKL